MQKVSIGALDLLDSTIVDTSLDINRGMWMQKVSTEALDLLDSAVVDTSLDKIPWNVDAKGGYRGPGTSGLYCSTVVNTSLDINRGMCMQKVSTGALDLLDSAVVDTSLDINRGMHVVATCKRWLYGPWTFWTLL